LSFFAFLRVLRGEKKKRNLTAKGAKVAKGKGFGAHRVFVFMSFLAFLRALRGEKKDKRAVNREGREGGLHGFGIALWERGL
jgi:hypothetical protein